MSTLEWSYDEFIAFMLIYVAHVDMDFSDEEKTIIRNNVGTEIYDKMLPIFNEKSDYQALEIILSYKPLYYPTPEQKDELLDKIKLLFNADHDFNTMEKELYHFMSRLM